MQTSDHHRLKPTSIKSLPYQACFRNSDEEIEVEYQSNTIGKYDLDFNGKNFVPLDNHDTAREINVGF
jgi:hypothetical protein